MAISIGLFVEMTYQAYEMSLIRRLNEYAHEKGISLMIFGVFPIHESHIFHSQGQKSVIDLADVSKLDGIILAGDSMIGVGFEDEIVKKIQNKAKCPVVNVRSGDGKFINVIMDNEECIYRMTNHFIKEHGFTDICFVTGKMNSLDAQQRLAGYKRAMADAGLEITDNMLYYGDYWKTHGKQIVDHFINSREQYPQVIICSND